MKHLEVTLVPTWFLMFSLFVVSFGFGLLFWQQREYMNTANSDETKQCQKQLTTCVVLQAGITSKLDKIVSTLSEF